jgi:hypothetical protein
VGVPVLLSWQGFVDAVVEVFVVGEDDMAADVVELVDRSGKDTARRWRTYKAFLGDVC